MDPFGWIRLGPSHWFADATEPIDHPLYVVLAALLTVALIAGIYTRLAADTMFGGHRFKQRLAARTANYVVALAAIGLLILLFRWQPVPLLSKRIWLYLWLLTVIGSIGYGIYYSRRLYPQRLFAYDESARRKRYLPRPSAGAGRARHRARRRH